MTSVLGNSATAIRPNTTPGVSAQGKLVLSEENLNRARRDISDSIVKESLARVTQGIKDSIEITQASIDRLKTSLTDRSGYLNIVKDAISTLPNNLTSKERNSWLEEQSSAESGIVTHQSSINDAIQSYQDQQNLLQKFKSYL